jgi:hypothetical protein
MSDLRDHKSVLVHTLSHGGVSAAHSCEDGSVNRGDCSTAMHVMQINFGIGERWHIPQLAKLKIATVTAPTPLLLHNLIPRKFGTEILIAFAHTGP